jgi:ABC-2 type transport system ATP-binding protein
MNAIEVGGLRKCYGERTILHGIDFRVGRGELVGLVGPNGAGKSTLLRSLVGLVRRDAGAMQVLGHDPATASLAIRRAASYLPGETGIWQQMTGAEFLRFALGFYPRHRAALHVQLETAFALPLQRPVRSYSAGMKQKLALLATLVPDVDLYLLDEPDRALDASVRFVLRDVLLGLRAAGKTIVLSSHHLAEVETLADRLEFLFDGRFVAPAMLAAARAQLGRRLRLRLRDAAALPPGAAVLATEPDGTLVVEASAEPLVWLRGLRPDRVASVEFGVVHLEDLYQLLQRDPALAGGAR